MLNLRYYLRRYPLFYFLSSGFSSVLGSSFVCPEPEPSSEADSSVFGDELSVVCLYNSAPTRWADFDNSSVADFISDKLSPFTAEWTFSIFSLNSFLSSALLLLSLCLTIFSVV